MQGLEGCNELIMFKEPKKRPGSGLDQGEERDSKKSEMGLNYVGLIYHDEELNLHVTA